VTLIAAKSCEISLYGRSIVTSTLFCEKSSTVTPQRPSPPCACGTAKATAGTHKCRCPPNAVTMLMQVTADDQTHVGPIELVEQSRPSRRHHARWARDIIGTLEEERLVQE
jgi:hypothetical protein